MPSPSYKSLALAVLLGGSTMSIVPACHAFVGSSSHISNAISHKSFATSTGTSTSLHAFFAPPPLIIGPMLKKMREEKAKQNMPLASDEERDTEAPGLRVGRGAWKWPPVWPYDREMFMRTEEIVSKQQQNALQGLMGGATATTATAVDSPDAAAAAAAAKLDLKQYWAEKAGVTTDIDEEAANKLRR